MAGKSDQAFRTISELAGELGVPQHILRYWETKFPQLRPLQRAGNRRYYRPQDVALARRIHSLLNHEGYTIRGVQRVLEQKEAPLDGASAPEPAPTQPVFVRQELATVADFPVERLRAIRDRLADALS